MLFGIGQREPQFLFLSFLLQRKEILSSVGARLAGLMREKVYCAMENVVSRCAGDIGAQVAGEPNVDHVLATSLFYISFVPSVPHLHIPPSMGTALGM